MARTSAIAMPVETPRKPMVSASRVSLFSRQIQISLSSAAADILFDRAAILSEGSLDGELFFGSTMVTFDLTQAAELVSDVCDAATVKRMADMIASDQQIRQRARALGATEAERHAQHPLKDVQVDIKVRSTGNHLHLDLDVEAAAREAS